jgi:hypothetical protein
MSRLGFKLTKCIIAKFIKLRICPIAGVISLQTYSDTIT